MLQLLIILVTFSCVQSINAPPPPSSDYAPPPPSAYNETECACENQGECIFECSNVQWYQNEYRGKISETADGLTCQHWDSQTPHEHNKTAENYPYAGLEENFCRNPDNDTRGAWCYTTDDSSTYGFCDISSCTETDCQDNNVWCEYWNGPGMGFCTNGSYTGYMAEECPLTCGYCSAANATVTDTAANVPTCYCTEGWEGDNCQIEDLCFETECFNNGTCEAITGNCTCTEGWTGDNCQIEDLCFSFGTDCRNNGTCEPTTGNCTCTEGWEGDNCDREDLCFESACDHGTCEAVSGNCTCNAGWEGDNCDTEDLCFENYCSYKGTCEAVSGNCTCNAGWTADNCNTEDLCYNTTSFSSNDCSTHGTCEPTTGNCTCTEGWTGDECEEEVCTKSCKRGKSCYFTEANIAKDKAREMKCRCPTGMYGKSCDQAPNCDITEKRGCQRMLRKNEDKFIMKCGKAWGPRKCPVSCGFCDH